ncbi:hypothetical protein [Liquorilactobacillus uvarum]|uniref:hypothetical protein n=1 Tax=Liquorilactobacillus uvarum TaxID=303240 RepID=UPI00288A3570|nr:hypothetical protein [Liquorilactobacillus uvarum]
MPAKKTTPAKKTVEQRLTEIEKNISNIQQSLSSLNTALNTKLSVTDRKKVYKMMEQYKLEQYKGL